MKARTPSVAAAVARKLQQVRDVVFYSAIAYSPDHSLALVGVNTDGGGSWTEAFVILGKSNADWQPLDWGTTRVTTALLRFLDPILAFGPGDGEITTDAQVPATSDLRKQWGRGVSHNAVLREFDVGGLPILAVEDVRMAKRHRRLTRQSRS
jgi:hypothetical protein